MCQQLLRNYAIIYADINCIYTVYVVAVLNKIILNVIFLIYFYGYL